MKLFKQIKSRMCINKTTTTKGFKVTLKSNMTVRKGIGCSSLDELREKVMNKFSMCDIDKFGIFTEDGTEVKPTLGFSKLIKIF